MTRYGGQFGPDLTFLGVPPCDLEDPSTYADADVVILVDYSGEQGEPDAGTRALLEAPTYERLAAVGADQAHVIDGTRTVGAAWARMGAFLDVLETHLLGARDDVVDETA